MKLAPYATADLRADGDRIGAFVNRGGQSKLFGASIEFGDRLFATNVGGNPIAARDQLVLSHAEFLREIIARLVDPLGPRNFICAECG